MRYLHKPVKILVALAIVILFGASARSPPGKAQEPSVRRFRILGVECTFDHIEMRSAQYLIGTLLDSPNWKNTSQYQACIELLSLHDYSTLNDTLKPFYRGLPTRDNICSEILNFLGKAEPGEIVIFYYCGHGQNKMLADPGISYTDLLSWLNTDSLLQACVLVILDTCHSGSWIADGEGGVLGPDRVVLTACTSSELAWGGGADECGFFTHYIYEGTYAADDKDNDGWISAAELFEYAKPKTEEFVEMAIQTTQTPTCYYGMIGGDVPLVQRNSSQPFPERDITVLSVNLSRSSVIAGVSVQIDYLARNQGGKTGIFTFWISYNSSVRIGSQDFSLSPFETRSLLFYWDTTGLCNGTYVITVSARITPCESNVDDNSNTDGAVHVQQKGLLLVPDQYATIQSAIDNASPKDIIKVKGGIYPESLTINKGIVIEGESSLTTIIEGNLSSTGIRVVADNVQVSNLTVRYCLYGLLLQNSSNCTFYDNALAMNHNGLFLERAGNNTFRNNTLSDNIYSIGIRGTEFPHFVNLMDNSNSVDEGPVCYWVGVHDCETPMNSGFVALINSTNITIRNANLKNNYDGILLVNTTHCMIEDSDFSGNYYGVSLIYSSENTITFNTVANNTCGVTAQFSDNCIIYYNNFINNRSPASLYESTLDWNFNKRGNFWSDYFGEDYDQDGIGDTGYPIGTKGLDNFPLMALAKRILVGTWDETRRYVTFVTVYRNIGWFDFDSNGMFIDLNISNPTSEPRFCLLDIPKYLLDCTEGIGSWAIMRDNIDVSTACNKWQDSTYTFIYVPCNDDFHSIRVMGTSAVPESTSLTSFSLSLILAFIVIAISRNRFR